MKNSEDTQASINLIPFARPMLGEEEQNAVQNVLKGHMLTHGPQCAAFEQEFADYLGVKHAITTSSCTTAMHLALVALGVGPGDEVLVPAMTHVATAHAVEHAGATVRFVDVLPDTGCMDPDHARQLITNKTRAILPVHYLGLPCDMDALLGLAHEYGLSVLEDSAAAMGAAWNGEAVGAMGDAGAFSFYPTKMMTTLEGGMLVTNRDDVADMARRKRAFAYDKSLGERSMPGLYDIDGLGWNYRMNEVQAAVGRCQLLRMPEFLALRRRNAERLQARLRDLSDLTLYPLEHDKGSSCCFCVNVTLPSDGRRSRLDLMHSLQAQGIGFSVHYPVALPFSKYYAKECMPSPQDYPVARWIADQTLSLPCGQHLSEDDIDRVADAVIAFFNKELGAKR